jgi:hypothetical protein
MVTTGRWAQLERLSGTLEPRRGRPGPRRCPGCGHGS